MKSFECKEKDFELDALSDREPMEILKDRGDVFTGTGVCQEAGSRVLDVLQFLESICRCTVKNTIAVVDSGCNEGMN